MTARLRRAAQESARLRETRSALRWVATLAAHGVPPTIVFEAITREVVRLSGADLARMERYDDNGTVTAVAGWTRLPARLVSARGTV